MPQNVILVRRYASAPQSDIVPTSFGFHSRAVVAGGDEAKEKLIGIAGQGANYPNFRLDDMECRIGAQSTETRTEHFFSCSLREALQQAPYQLDEQFKLAGALLGSVGVPLGETEADS